MINYTNSESIISTIVQSDEYIYPSSKYSFSPSKHYPEYPFKDISPEKNNVYEAVRDMLFQSGYDRANYNTPKWNPLGDIINRKDKVFILCNFVFHQRNNESIQEFNSKCTHGSVVRALIDYVFLATGKDGVIRFGNSPLQSCDFKRVLDDTGAIKVEEYYDKLNLNIKSKDLRMYVTEESLTGVRKVRELKENHYTTTVNMDSISLLEKQKNNVRSKYRVSNYDHSRTEKLQSDQNHKYIINNDILTSDVIISIPKLKTHEKVGITVGLKGFVGIVGHKDCLAHHRFGPPSIGGDEYPESTIRIIFSQFHDIVNKYNNIPIVSATIQIIDKLVRRLVRNLFKKVNAGAWHGNDTAWRMTLDLSRIVHYADIEGNMQKTIQRKNIVLVDGIVGGEGEGPLSSKPVDSGVLIFSNNVAMGDIVACNIMGYDYKKIPLLLNSIGNIGLVSEKNIEDGKVVFNGEKITVKEIKNYFNHKYLTPRGWSDHLK